MPTILWIRARKIMLLVISSGSQVLLSSDFNGWLVERTKDEP